MCSEGKSNNARNLRGRGDSRDHRTCTPLRLFETFEKPGNLAHKPTWTFRRTAKDVFISWRNFQHGGEDFWHQVPIQNSQNNASRSPSLPRRSRSYMETTKLHKHPPAQMLNGTAQFVFCSSMLATTQRKLHDKYIIADDSVHTEDSAHSRGNRLALKVASWSGIINGHCERNHKKI